MEYEFEFINYYLNRNWRANSYLELFITNFANELLLF